MRRQLLFLGFLEGAAVMAAELCGARFLSPIFGSSLMVWASVMGITLGALAAGYFYGGYLSGNSKQPEKSLKRMITAAGLFTLSMPLIAHYLVPRISYLPFTAGMLAATFILLFFPVFFLGSTSPLFILCQVRLGMQAGRAGGLVYGVSTAGGILATFLCGFWFIPDLGLNLSILVFGAALFLSNFLVFRKINFTAAVIFFGIIFFSFTITKKSLLYAESGIQGELEVFDEFRGNTPIRVLRLNNIIQSEMDLRTKLSVSEYVYLLDSIIPVTPKGQNALVLGLGGGLVARLIAAKGYSCTGVEFDERISSAAKNFFYLDKNVKTINQDARYFLNSDTTKYAVIFFDVFKAEEQPSHVITVESLRQLKKNMSDSCELLINWHGYMNGKVGEGSAILFNTLKTAGFFTECFDTGPNEDHRNVIFRSTLYPHNKSGKVPDLTTSRVNTDNNQLLEKYNALANKRWRTQYLRYYQMQ